MNNHPEEFPDLNLYSLQRYAKRWATERPAIKGIRLYHYRSILYSRYSETVKAKYYSTKYAIVFDGDDLEKLSNDITDDQGIYPKLIDSGFLDVYRVKPVEKFQYDWTFTTADRAAWNQFSSIMVNEGYWDLYPAKEDQAPAAEAVTPVKEEPENYFQRNGNHWAIKFGSEYAAHVDLLDGLFYIAHILSRPGESIADLNLYNLVNCTPRAISDEKSDEKTAISNNLSDQIKYQESLDQQASNDYVKKYKQLQIDLEDAESDLERKEIEEEMNVMIPFLKKRNLAGQKEKNIQRNITKRLNKAYESLEREGMAKLASHLIQCIKTANYSRVYTGGFVWEIFL